MLMLLLLAALLAAAPQTSSATFAPDDAVDADIIKAEAAWLQEAQTGLLAQQLSQMLRGADEDQPPLLFDTLAADAQHTAAQDAAATAATAAPPGKRSRYYRRYPWKRQPGRGAQLEDNPYLCNPTREDVFRLLAALHEARAGNLGRTVSFCNRRRPAAAVFTNIRFLGRRRRR